jgi:HEAT repeat protein
MSMPISRRRSVPPAARRFGAALAAAVLGACAREAAKPLTVVKGSVAALVREIEASTAGDSAAGYAAAASRPASREALDLLEGFVSSPQSKIGVKAREAFLALPPADGAAAIRSFATSPDAPETSRARACALLASFVGSPDAAEAALDIARRPMLDEETRAAAASAAAAIGVDAILADLLLCLKYEKSERVFSLLTYALARIGNLSGVEDLRGVLRRGNCEEAPAIARAILQEEGIDMAEGFSGEELDAQVLGLYSRWWHEGSGRRSAAKPGARTRLGFARYAARLGDRDLRPVDDSRYVLARGGKLAVESLTAALLDDDLYTRVRAIEVAGSLGPAASSLVDRLVDLAGFEGHRAEPLIALGRVRDKRATPVLVKSLTSENLDVRVAAARGLDALQDPASSGALGLTLDALRPPAFGGAPDLALLCARALAGLGDFRGVAVLVQLHDVKAPVEPGALEEALTFAFGRIRDAGKDDAGFGQAPDAAARWAAARDWAKRDTR